MKLFWKAHMPMVIVLVVSWSLVLGIYWLDGYRNLVTGIYAMVLGLFVVCGYLLVRYINTGRMYRYLSTPIERLQPSVPSLGTAPEPVALQAHLKQQYACMQQELQHTRYHQATHLSFINQWVHQMKTPLAVMDLALQGEETNTQTASMREELDRMRDGLDTVLHAARLQTFEQDFHVRSLQLDEIVEKAVYAHKRLFIHSRVYPVVEAGPDITIQSDEKWLLFMMGQLLTNAIKYSISPEDEYDTSSDARIHIRWLVRGNQAVLEIQDHGIGIPAADLKRICAPFYTGSNGRKYRESTGMGLYLVSQACEKLQHGFEWESKEGEGTTVRFVFSAYLAISP